MTKKIVVLHRGAKEIWPGINTIRIKEASKSHAIARCCIQGDMLKILDSNKKERK